MTYGKAVASSIVGLAMIVFGILCNKFYYAKGMYGGNLGRVAPLWFGRILFIGIGTVFIIVGMYYLLFQQ
jgi:hypothetical protein